jgi:hypothetical protein
MPTSIMKAFALFACVVVCLAGFCFGQTDGHTYKTGYSSIMKLGKDIHNAIKPQHRDTISPQPISVETDVAPVVKLLFLPEEPKPARGVWISAGFIDLVNNVAHAKAIDTKQRGYFKKYADLLAQESGRNMLSPLPNDDNPKFWTDDMLNEQQSNFNSIVGIMVGIKLAHHYLGHYDKYKARLSDTVSINSLITPEEWDQAFRVGLRNALEAGCMIEGVIPFFQTLDKMKVRPPWAIYFLPENVKFAKLRRDMEKMQERFLWGEE